MELRATRDVDWNALMRAVLLIALTAFLARLIWTGRIGRYIHPKFTWFTASAGIGFLIMAAGQMIRFVRGAVGPVAPFRTEFHLMLISVICVGFVAQPHTFGADLAGKQGLNITSRSSSASALQPPVPESTPVPAAPSSPAPQPPNPPAPAAASSAPAAPVPVEARVITLTPPEENIPATAKQSTPKQPDPPLLGDTITVTDKNYVNLMFAFYDKPWKFSGTRMVIDGCTFYPPDTGASQFAVTRLVVTCHVAHAAPEGMLVVLPPGQRRPAQDTWHRVEGMVRPVTYNGKEVLGIQMEKMTPIAKPTDPYVYP